MDRFDKGKLRVLIKMILIERSPKWMTANQITNIINSHNYGFRTDITASKVSKLINMESNATNSVFMKNIHKKKGKNKINMYQYKVIKK